MRILLDTNCLTDVLRRDPGVVRTVEEALEVWLPFITFAEIQAGFHAGSPSRRAHNEALLARFLSLPAVDTIYPDRETTAVYARVFSQLREAGTPIPTNDLWIASLAIQHQLTLVSRDAHFAKIPQVARAKP